MLLPNPLARFRSMPPQFSRYDTAVRRTFIGRSIWLPFTMKLVQTPGHRQVVVFSIAMHMQSCRMRQFLHEYVEICSLIPAATLSLLVTSQKLPTRQNSWRCVRGSSSQATFHEMARKIVSISDAFYKTGSIVPESGIYAVRHAPHLLPSEVTLMQGEVFPRCEACEGEVQFRLLRKVVERDPVFRFRVQLYQLPVLDQPRRKAG